MANILGAMTICENRIRAKWEQIAENRMALEKLCAKANKVTSTNKDLAEKFDEAEKIFEENRKIMQEIEKLYSTLLKI